jgi:hypothetical protein
VVLPIVVGEPRRELVPLLEPGPPLVAELGGELGKPLEPVPGLLVGIADVVADGVLEPALGLLAGLRLLVELVLVVLEILERSCRLIERAYVVGIMVDDVTCLGIVALDAIEALDLVLELVAVAYGLVDKLADATCPRSFAISPTLESMRDSMSLRSDSSSASATIPDAAIAVAIARPIHTQCFIVPTPPKARRGYHATGPGPCGRGGGRGA